MAKAAENIIYEGDNTTFIWKHPCEDFDSNTTLTVHESQEAIFFLNGQALDLFPAGKYTLKTENTPKITGFFKRLIGEVSPFHAEVYFINKTEQMAIKWGTDSKVQFMEPKYNFPISIGASGEMSLRVEDSRRLLIKVVGTEKHLGQAKLTQLFRAFLMTKVKSYIARVIRQEEISIFEIDEHLEEISESLRKALYEDFLDYGVALERFFITTVLKPDGEASYEKFKDLHFRQYSEVAEAKLRQQVGVIDAHTSAQKTIIESQAIATKRAQEGYTYQDERNFDVAEIVAANDAPMPFGSVNIGNITATAPTPAPAAPAESESKCHACGKVLLPDAKFCPECGEKVLPKIPEGMVLCPECRKIVVKSKFCPECGHKMATVCRECGKETGGAKFCPECGAKQ